MMNSPRRRARQSRRRLQLTKTRARRMDDGRTVAKTVSGGYLAGQTDRQTDRQTSLLGGVEPTFSSRMGRIVWEAIAICHEDTTTEACHEVERSVLDKNGSTSKLSKIF